MNSTQATTLLLALSGASLLFSACQKDATAPAVEDNTPVTRPLTEAEAKTVHSANDFAFRSFAALQAKEASKNLFISPLSISAALTMAYNGADGTTKEAMRQTLGFQPQTDEQIGQAYQSLNQLLRGIDKRVTFTPANSIWHGKQYQLAAPFVQKNSTYFDATVQALDFNSPDAVKTINGWVSDKTQGKIDGIVEDLSPEHVMVLVNAIYFKGVWTYPFDKKLTQKAPFRRDDGSQTDVDFMSAPNSEFLYYEDAQHQVIDLPYGNKQFSMTLILPLGQNTVSSIVRNLSNAQLTGWLTKAKPSGLPLRLPRFKMTYKATLNDMLSQLGMGEAFSSRANFSQMLAGGSRNLAIDAVLHKTYVEVNEEGTEAAAVTSVGIVTTSIPPTIAVDRACVFLIREKSSNAILFIGQLMNP
ncbi:serpin family protein [Hymenobacter metallicola]|uniref:Serpin family protein n=1 Tax=Hymenobacter metallicola TaxID=2563114 RepID=A0A4Z0PZX5_9BACT|nr:serpin family protein [Hymenobacter metallicola]TGE23328.1 serpin family protein [Hymenobacter metallicola]